MNWYGGTTSSRNRATGIWRQDEGGSLQAVYALLRDLGVRWYWHGETGEVVPQRESIELPTVERTVHPDFAMRNHSWYNRFDIAPADNVLWWLRLGLNDGYTVLGASMHVHGMRLIQRNKTMQEQHPEYFALYGGERDTEYRGSGHACFSSPGLFEETVKYLRAAFDHFDEPAMDLWPQDGYHHCGCELCEGKTPSELVWGFVDRVARELYETHPDRLITCGAYTEYIRPPGSIEKFSPNVAVMIANRNRPGLVDPEVWQSYWDLISAWREKLAPDRLIRYENNRFGRSLVIHPRAFARDLRALKGMSLGDMGEVRRGTPSNDCWPNQWPNPAVNHLNIYVQSRLLWDAERDLDALLEEYYDLFYGPAADVMQEALDSAEQNYNRRGARMLPLEHRVPFVEKLHEARAQAGDTVHGKRIQTFINELPPLEKLRADLQAQLEAGDEREDAPVAIGHVLPGPPDPPVYRLKGIVDGEEPEVETTFQVGWDDGTLVFDVTCYEPEMDDLFVTPDVWGGDSVAFLLETPFHSYYQIEVNPDGVVFDSNRAYGERGDNWNSKAEVATERGEDFWRLTVRLPVMPEDVGAGDPLHNVVGSKPTEDAPWYFNVGRVRVRGVGGVDRTLYSFSPTGRATYHEKGRFARLIIK